MKDIERRIEKLEAMLGVGQESQPHSIVLLMVSVGGKYFVLPEPVEQWLTYQEQLANRSPFIMLTADKELEVRKGAERTDLDLVGTWRSIYDERY